MDKQVSLEEKIHASVNKNSISWPWYVPGALFIDAHKYLKDFKIGTNGMNRKPYFSNYAQATIVEAAKLFPIYAVYQIYQNFLNN